MKIKLRLLIVTMLISLKIFSQTATPTQPNNDTVKITKTVAKKIAEELILLDAVKQENIILKEDTALLQKQLSLREASLKVKDIQIDMYKSNISAYDKKEHVYQDMLKSSEHKLKWMKFQRTGLGVLLVASISFLAFKQ